MMDDASKARLLDEFRAYLESCDASEGGVEDAEDNGGETDLFTLFSEMAALRTEVKSENRLLRAALDELKSAQGSLRDSQGKLDLELERARGESSGLRRAALRPVLLELLDLYDRLAAGHQALQSYRPATGAFGRIKSRPEDRRFIDSIREGQGMSLRRLEELLARREVRPLHSVGQPVDPHTMTVVELDRRPELENGVVTAELRKGFLWGDEVLRLAEVKANKL